MTRGSKQSPVGKIGKQYSWIDLAKHKPFTKISQLQKSLSLFCKSLQKVNWIKPSAGLHIVWRTVTHSESVEILCINANKKLNKSSQRVQLPPKGMGCTKKRCFMMFLFQYDDINPLWHQCDVVGLCIGKSVLCSSLRRLSYNILLDVVA